MRHQVTARSRFATRLSESLLSLAVALIACGPAAAVEPHRGHTRPGCLPGVPWADYQYRARSPSETAVSRTGILLRARISVEDVQPGPLAFSRGYSDEQVLRNYPVTGERHIERRIEQTVVLPENTGTRLSQLESRTDPLPPLPEDELAERLRPDVTRRLLTNNFTALAPAPPVPQRTVVELYQLDRARLQIDHCEISQVALQLHDSGQWVLSLRADQNRRAGEDEAAAYNPFLHIRRNQFVVRLRCLGAFQNEPLEGEIPLGKPVLAELEPCAFWVENGQPYYLRTGRVDSWVKEHFAEIDRVEIEFFYYRQQGSPVFPLVR